MNESFYDNQPPLNEAELKAAILEGKKRRYFHEKHRDYWQEKEEKKVKGKHITNL